MVDTLLKSCCSVYLEEGLSQQEENADLEASSWSFEASLSPQFIVLGPLPGSALKQSPLQTSFPTDGPRALNAKAAIFSHSILNPYILPLGLRSADVLQILFSKALQMPLKSYSELVCHHATPPRHLISETTHKNTHQKIHSKIPQDETTGREPRKQPCSSLQHGLPLWDPVTINFTPYTGRENGSCIA